MFEIGKYYKVRMWEDGEDGGVISEYAAAKVIEIAPPLVKLKSSVIAGGGELILNTASFAFISAEIE
jgi:hypothetical protein